MDADLERRATLPVPRACPSESSGGRSCRGTAFTPVPEEAVHTDYQEVRADAAGARRVHEPCAPFSRNQECMHWRV